MKKSKSIAPGLQKEQIYILKLYVADGEPNSRIARENLKSICDEYLRDRYQLEEVDALTNSDSALKDRVFVTPTLVLVAPEPRATIVGNLASKDTVISTLRLRVKYETQIEL
jgi:circadian clock protein KaiB